MVDEERGTSADTEAGLREGGETVEADQMAAARAEATTGSAAAGAAARAVKVVEVGRSSQRRESYPGVSQEALSPCGRCQRRTQSRRLLNLTGLRSNKS